MSKQVVPEFSYLLAVDKIPAAGVEVTLDANAKERAALAGRFGLPELTKLHAVLTASHEKNNRSIAVTGRIKASATQTCVITLEPLPTELDFEIRTLFVEPDMLDSEDENIEPLTNGTIDLGELTAQHFGTALDPYPRKPGLSFVDTDYGAPVKKENPFAKLKVIKTEE